MAILVAIVLLIMALTGVLLETTWGNSAGYVVVTPTGPGSVARC
jgi:hypothetical protein